MLLKSKGKATETFRILEKTNKSSRKLIKSLLFLAFLCVSHFNPLWNPYGTSFSLFFSLQFPMELFIFPSFPCFFFVFSLFFILFSSFPLYFLAFLRFSHFNSLWNPYGTSCSLLFSLQFPVELLICPCFSVFFLAFSLFLFVFHRFF